MRKMKIMMTVTMVSAENRKTRPANTGFARGRFTFTSDGIMLDILSM